MKRKTLTMIAGAAALTMALAACGSSTSSGGGSTPSSSGSSSTSTIASKLILGGPPEFQTRSYGIAGLARVYNVKFGTFKALDEGGPLTITALKNGQIDAGDIFTTDPSITADNFVVLDDPKNLFAAQNVLPLINASKATAGVKQVLNAISAKITTADLIALNVKVEANKEDPDTAAKQWLATAGLDTAGTEAAGSSLTVGSANFPENVVLADIYAEALKAQGAKISTKLNIGSRETYIPGLKDGSIDLIPEYSGNLLEFLQPTATAVSSDDVYAALQKALPSTLIVLNQSAAQDKDAIVVTKATATKYNLTSIADLANPS